MSPHKIILLLGFAAQLSAAPIRIMPLGDSITAGYTDNPTWNVPFEFGYRSRLYTLLTNAGYHFQFVGASLEPFDDLYGDPTHGGTVSPTLDLRPLGQNGHRGYGGKTISYINTNVAGYIAADSPDIILLMIGINGISSTSPTDLDTLVGTIFTAKPSVNLIVAQITPKIDYNADLYNYNTYIRNTLVPKYKGLGRNISTVDQYKNFLTNPADPTSINRSLYANGINHPDNPTYNLMAATWFAGVMALAVDSDADGIADSWEMAKAGNLTSLTATGDFDGDQLGDVAEYNLSLGAYPNIDPTKRDTDGDGLDDGAEIRGAGLRPPTDPTLADTDHDNISDYAEDNSGIYLGPLHPGTNPALADTDADGRADGVEILEGSNPLVASSPGPVLVTYVSSSSSELAYANDVSATDLLQGLTGTSAVHSGWNLNNSASPAKLNDGVLGGSNIPVQGAWAVSSGTVSTFTLNPGNGNGWDISGITTFAAWLNAGFGNQRYDVAIRRVGESAYTTLASVNYEPFTVTGGGGSKVTIRHTSGVLARGVVAVRFTMLATNGNGGGAVYREFDVFGTATPAFHPSMLEFSPPATANPGVAMTWLSRVGKTYRVEKSNDLKTWTPVETTLPSGGVTTTLRRDANPATEPRAFFRVSENP